MQRLRAFIQEQIEKFARFRGVLPSGLSRMRTGDYGFQAGKTAWLAFVSVAILGGSISLLIRLGERRGSTGAVGQYVE